MRMYWVFVGMAAPAANMFATDHRIGRQ